MRALFLSAWVAGAFACAPAEEPPGRSAYAPERSTALARPPPAASGTVEVGDPADAKDEPGGGARIASIAMRTWIYVAPDDRSTKLGYLRAGAVVDRAERSAGTKGCAGGWYRIAPRGYVCVGKGATLALDHQVVLAATRGPDRGAPTPYRYVLSKEQPPHLYFRLPTRDDQLRVEGPTLPEHLARAISPNVGDPDPVPAFLEAGRDLPKPYGAEEKLRYSVHTGRASDKSAFGLVTTFEWTGRRFGLTTELDLVPLDRTRSATISAMRGALVEGGEGTPAMVGRQGAPIYRVNERGEQHPAGQAPPRSPWILTGRDVGGRERGLLETTAGVWIPAESLLLPSMREDPVGFARDGKRWIEVTISKQLLVAYEGKRPVFATLVSTGIGELGDPETTHATVRGTFLIHAKHVSATMDGDEASDAFDLRDVPYVQYFHEGYALHGAYWHDDFGKARSHGCVNLSPADAAWLFEWTEPVVPREWHGAVNPEGGTLVWIHK